jgi:hypothetical protein
VICSPGLSDFRVNCIIRSLVMVSEVEYFPGSRMRARGKSGGVKTCSCSKRVVNIVSKLREGSQNKFQAQTCDHGPDQACRVSARTTE